MSLLFNKSLSIFISKNNLIHNRISITQKTIQRILTIYYILLSHLSRIQNLLFFQLNFITQIILILYLQITFKIVLILLLLFREILSISNPMIFPSSLSPFQHSLLSSIMINRIKKLSQIEFLNFSIKLIKLNYGQLSLNQILILFPTQSRIILPDLLIITLLSVSTNLSQNLTNSFYLQMFIYSIFRINKYSIMIIWINQRIYSTFVFFQL
jgi:hypothetical protein